MLQRQLNKKETPLVKKAGVNQRRSRVKRSREWLEREKVLKMEALGALLRSRILLRNAERICDAIDKQVAIDLDNLGWEEKEKWYAEADRLDKAIMDNEAAFKKLHEVYDDVCMRVNAFYGKEVMVPQKFESIVELCDESGEEDSSDWWRKVE